MRLKNTASQPTSPYSCHLPSLLVRQEFLAWSSSIGKSRGWEIDPFSVLGLSLELVFRLKRSF